MKSNIGLTKLHLLKLVSEYHTNNRINESSTKINDFINTINNSEILQLEFKVISNLESKYINEDILAARFIDSNIKLFEVYTLKEINNEHDKLKQFISEDIEKESRKYKLYESIGNLITESLKSNLEIDVNVVHESFSTVLKHITENKPEESTVEVLDENIIRIAIDKFNEKYSMLEEDDKTMLLNTIKLNESEKKIVLDEQKKEILTLLNEVTDVTIKDKIDKTIQKLNEIKYEPETINNNLIDLYELKKSLS